MDGLTRLRVRRIRNFVWQLYYAAVMWYNQKYYIKRRLKNIEEIYGHDLLELDNDTFVYQVDSHYKEDLINIIKVIENISADDFEKLCALFLKEIVKCEAVNATQRSHDQGIDFAGYKKYVQCLTTNEQNENLLYVIGQAKHYKSECVKVSEIRELAGSIYLMRMNDFFVFSNRFNGMNQSEIMNEIRKIERIS